MVNILLRPAVVDFVEVARQGADLEIDQIEVGPQSEMAEKSLEELQLPRRVGVHIVAVNRSAGETVYNPPPELRLQVGDTVILIGPQGSGSALRQLRL